MVKNQKIVIINKFFDTEAKINCLIDILDTTEIDKTELTKKSQKFLLEVVPQYIEQKK
jgi:hypothetical protein